MGYEIEMSRPPDLCSIDAQVIRAMPFESWPRQDRLAWLGAIAEGDPLEEVGPAAHWATASKRKCVREYGRWLSFLLRTNGLDTEVSPADRVSPGAIAAYIEHQRERV